MLVHSRETLRNVLTMNKLWTMPRYLRKTIHFRGVPTWVPTLAMPPSLNIGLSSHLPIAPQLKLKSITKTGDFHILSRPNQSDTTSSECDAKSEGCDMSKETWDNMSDTKLLNTLKQNFHGFQCPQRHTILGWAMLSLHLARQLLTLKESHKIICSSIYSWNLSGIWDVHSLPLPLVKPWIPESHMKRLYCQWKIPAENWGHPWNTWNWDWDGKT